MNINFTVCLITRNESKTLPRLAESLKEFQAQGGEVCMLDTGSIDGTSDIGRSFGWNVQEVGEKYLYVVSKEEADAINNTFVIEGEQKVVKEGDKYFDFSSARNAAAEMATNDMISCVDADEIFSKMDIDKIQEHITNGITQFEYNFVFAHDQYGAETIKFVQSKFYDRRKLQWVGIIHEVLQGDGNRLFMTEDVFKLEHWQNQETNRGGYLKGLAIDCFRHPDADRNSHYFARELFWANRPKSAIKEFERHVAMNRWPAERAQSMIFIGDCYGKLNKPEKQCEWYSKAFYFDSSRRESLIKLARFFQYNKNYLAAKAMTVAALEIPWGAFYGNDLAHYTTSTCEILYDVSGWTGDVERSKKYLLEALSYQPQNQKYLYDTRYYFEYFDRAIEGWMTFPELTWLYETAKGLSSIAEIGSWKGRSTHALLSGCSGTVTAIDYFEGSKEEHDGTNERFLEETQKTYETFMKNVGEFKNLEVMKLSSAHALQHIEDKQYEMVFIDAGHSYEEVLQDIKDWLPHAKYIICGHDYSDKFPGVMKAVNEIFGDVQHADTIWYKILKPKVSFILPTLHSRPEGLKRCLESIKDLNFPQCLIEIKVVHDYPRLGVAKRVEQGVNETTGEYIVYASDDTEFTRESLSEALKETYSLVAFNTGNVLPDDGNICEHFMIRRDMLLKIDNQIFDTDFHHVGVDNLLWQKCKKLNEAVRCDKAIVKHYHFTQGAEFDDTYKLGWSTVEDDRALLAIKLKQL